jgi:hypothetical protein
MSSCPVECEMAFACSQCEPLLVRAATDVTGNVKHVFYITHTSKRHYSGHCGCCCCVIDSTSLVCTKHAIHASAEQ